MGEDLFVCKCGTPSSDYKGALCSGCETFYCSDSCVKKCDCGNKCIACKAYAEECTKCEFKLCDDCHSEEECNEMLQSILIQEEIKELKIENAKLKCKLAKLKMIIEL